MTEAMAVADRIGEGFWEAELYRLRGELLLDTGSPSRSVAAEESFQKAIAVARARSAKALELRAVMSLARLWQQQGRKEDACEVLVEIQRWFTEGFDTPDLIEARTLLTALTNGAA